MPPDASLRGAICKSTGAPLRVILKSMGAPAEPRTTVVTSAGLVTGLPATPVTRSPGCRPTACAALPATTSSTVVVPVYWP